MPACALDPANFNVQIMYKMMLLFVDNYLNDITVVLGKPNFDWD